MLFQQLRTGTFPSVGDYAALADFRGRLINRFSAYRNRHMERITTNYWFALGRQDVIRDLRLSIDGSRGYVVRDRTSRMGGRQLPRPVSNYCSPAIEVEMSAQSKRQWTPQVIPEGDDPRVIAAAKESERILQHDLERDHWPLVRDRFTHQTIVAGTGIIWSLWDENYNDLAVSDPGTAVTCVSCQGVLASADLSIPLLENFRKQGGSVAAPDSMRVRPTTEDSDPAMELTRCPGCGGELIPTELDPDADLMEQDHFGRELGLLMPRGTPHYELVEPHEFYPDNAGIGFTPETLRRFAIRKVRSLSTWVEERYPDRVDELQPKSPAELMASHPILGEWDILGRFSGLDRAILDRGIYDEHVFVDTLVELPTLRYPDGRLTVLCDELVLEDGDLILKAANAHGDRDKVQKHSIYVARYKERPGEFWGESILDQILSPQKRLNRINMQEDDTQVRLGSPHILKPEDMNLTGPEYNAGWGGGKFLNYRMSPTFGPQAKPEVIGGQYFYAHFKESRLACIEDIKALVGPQDVEVGEAPRNIGTTSGLQVLGEQAERRRAARERAIVYACEGAWSHRLQLLWCLRTDSDYDSYLMKGAQNTWAMKQWSRLSIAGQTLVRIEKQAYIDRSLYQREAAREAQEDGLYNITGPQAQKRLLELRGLPTDVNEDANRQINHAERQWADFMSGGRIPVIDETLDDPILHHQVLGTCLLRDETENLEDEVGWNEMVPLLAGWESDLETLQMLEQRSLAYYGARIPEPGQKQAEVMAYARYDSQMEMWEQGSAQAQQLVAGGGQAPALPPAPLPPPPAFFLPPYLPRVILQIWQKKLQEGGWQPPPPQFGKPGKDPDSYLQFRTVYEAYRALAAASMNPMAPPGPAPPGGGPAPPGGPQGPMGGGTGGTGGVPPEPPPQTLLNAGT